MTQLYDTYPPSRAAANVAESSSGPSSSRSRKTEAQDATLVAHPSAASGGRDAEYELEDLGLSSPTSATSHNANDPVLSSSSSSNMLRKGKEHRDRTQHEADLQQKVQPGARSEMSDSVLEDNVVMERDPNKFQWHSDYLYLLLLLFAFTLFPLLYPSSTDGGYDAPSRYIVRPIRRFIRDVLWILAWIGGAVLGLIVLGFAIWVWDMIERRRIAASSHSDSDSSADTSSSSDAGGVGIRGTARGNPGKKKQLKMMDTPVVLGFMILLIACFTILPFELELPSPAFLMRSLNHLR